jgi:uncharacterized membrane protein
MIRDYQGPGMMRIKNIFQINDWNIRDFISVILTIQASVLSLVILHFLGLDLRNELPFQLLAFLYVTFVPGFLILRILRMHKMGNIKSLLFAMGLSIFSVMMTGFFINQFLPLAGISHPITYEIVVTAMFIVVAVLSYLCYIRDRDYANPDFINLKSFFDSTTLFLLALPILSIFSTSLMNISHNNVLQMALLLVIAAIPLLVSLNVIGEKYYPLTIFSASLALLLHTSLITGYVWGADVNREVYLANQVISGMKWDVSIYDTVNAMMSITILSPVYAILMNARVEWVYKIVYQLIFSFMPLGMYYVVKKQTDARIAFYTLFFFIFFFIFYTEMPALARQEIAELFVILLIMVVIDSVGAKTDRLHMLVLSIIFGVSIVISHYGTTYIYAICILISGLISALPFLNLKKRFNDARESVILNRSYPVLLFIFMLIWFTYLAGSMIFTIGVSKGYLFALSLSDLLNPSTTQALGIATMSMPLFQSVERYMHLVCQLFIVIGVVTTILLKKFKFAREYYVLSIGCLILAIVGFVMPHLSNALNSDRLYHLTLFLLAPFLIVGIVNAAGIVSRNKLNVRHVYIAIAGFLTIFFLLNSAFLYQVFDQPKLGRFALDENSDFSIAYPDELTAIGWLMDNRNPDIRMYASIYKYHILLGFFGYAEPFAVNPYIADKLDVSYLYLGTYDIRDSIALNQQIGGYLEGYTFNFAVQHQIYDGDTCKLFMNYY